MSVMDTMKLEVEVVNVELDILERAAVELESAPPQEILRWGVERYRPRPRKLGEALPGAGVALACSFGMQSVVCIDMLWRMKLLKDVEVFYLDTGVLFDETHQTRMKIQERYDFEAVRVAADMTWEEQRAKFGGELFERGPEGINQCCHIRKVVPMKNHLAGKAAWITGMRRHHSQTRAQVPVVMWDHANGMAKINPVATMDSATLWGYIKANGVPYNPLYDQGYKSIGCNTPVCTRPVKEGEDERAGRWGGVKTECGIHVDGKVIRSLDSSQL
ncbi:MAG: phosphoadenylyl-sulfate reductase [Phycisphaerales bacterium]